MFAQSLEAVRSQTPRIHCISNIVSAPLCANGLIAIGAAPIMAESPLEVAEITANCHGLCLNLGTPNPQKLEAMVLAGQTANALGHPVVFDPVAVGGSTLRREGARNILQSVRCTAIRGNLSEIKILAGEAGQCLGVDAGDTITQENLPQIVHFAQEFSQNVGAIIAISGAVDLVTDGSATYLIHNGHPMLSTVSGSGCLLSATLTAYLAANPTRPLLATVTSLCVMGYCGQLAATSCKGNGSFSVDLLDALGNLTGDQLEKGANYVLYTE